MFHQIIVDIYMVSAIVALIEDGGEMIALSLLVWYFCFLASKSDGNSGFLFNYIFPKRRSIHFQASYGDTLRE